MTSCTCGETNLRNCFTLGAFVLVVAVCSLYMENIEIRSETDVLIITYHEDKTPQRILASGSTSNATELSNKPTSSPSQQPPQSYLGFSPNVCSEVTRCGQMKLVLSALRDQHGELFEKLGKKEVLQMLRGRRIWTIGDSMARYVRAVVVYNLKG